VNRPSDAVLDALAVAADAKRAWLAVQTGAEHAARHAAADEYERARRAALRAVDDWIDQTARTPSCPC
jgi:hypothetical protein